MRTSIAALIVGGLGFLVFGLLMLLAPRETMAAIGFVLPEGLPTTEIRAFYGGLELALAGLLLAAAALPAYRRAGLILGGVSYGGIGLSRALGMMVDDTSGAFLWTALLIELGLAIWFWWAWRKDGQAAAG